MELEELPALPCCVSTAVGHEYEKLNGTYRFDHVVDGKSIYKNESNDQGVFIDFGSDEDGGYWAMRDRTRTAVAKCFGGFDGPHPPIGLGERWTFGQKGLCFLHEKTYSPFPELFFCRGRDIRHRTDMFELYSFCGRWKPYTSKEKTKANTQTSRHQA